MNTPTLSSPDRASELPAQVESPAPPAATGCTRKPHGVTRRYWWLPLLTLVISLGVAWIFVWWMPPTFVTLARLWQPVTLQLPEGPLFTEDMRDLPRNLSDLLHSDRGHELALERLKSMQVAIPLSEGTNPLPVNVRFIGGTNSSIFTIEASGANPAYTQAYLNALINSCLQLKKDARKEISGESLAAIEEMVLRLERDLKTEQDCLYSFQRTNHSEMLQLQAKVAVEYLGRLETQYSDLKLEERLQGTPKVSQVNADSRQLLQAKMGLLRDAIAEWEPKYLNLQAHLAEVERLRSNVQRLQPEYERLVALLRRVDIRRHIEQESLSMLEPASPAKRCYAPERRLLTWAGCSGLGVGVGVMLVMILFGARQHTLSLPQAGTVQGVKIAELAARLEQLKALHEKGLLSREACDQKVKEIIGSI